MKVTLIDSMGSDLTVVNAARVSFDKESRFEYDDVGYRRLKDSDVKLVRYLAKNNHWTPFGHVQATFCIDLPIFVARQLMRSNVGIVYNEVSRRYVTDEPTFFQPTCWRSKPEGSIKQGSGNKVITGGFDEDYNKHLDNSLALYNKMLDDGVAPEMARMVLPLATYTSLWMTGSLIAFARVCKLRLDGHAQKEIQQIAEDLYAELGRLYPVCWYELMIDFESQDK